MKNWLFSGRTLALASPSVPLLDGACLLDPGELETELPSLLILLRPTQPLIPQPCSLLLSLLFVDSSDRFLVNSVVRIGTSDLCRPDRRLKRETSGHSDRWVWHVHQPPLLYLARRSGAILPMAVLHCADFAWEWGGDRCLWFWLSRLLSRGKSGFRSVSF